jgi:hypothetical protein
MTPPQWNAPNPDWQGQPVDPRYAPGTGFTVPGYVQQPGIDPLISPDYNGWWTRAIEIVKRAWKPLAGLQAIGLLIALAIQAPVAAYVALRSEEVEAILANPEQQQEMPDLTPLLAVLGFTLLLALLGLIAAAIITVASVHIGVSSAVGAPVQFGEALKLAGRRVFPLLGWQLLAIPIYVVAVCLCVLPVFYIAAVFTVLPAVVAIERTNAIGRCFTLFHRNLGPSAARTATIIGISIGVSVLAAIFGSVFDAVGRQAADGTSGVVIGSVIGSFFAAVLSGALAVLLAPLTLTAYADMRARVEPLNSAVIAQQLGIAVPAGMWPAAPPSSQDPPSSQYPPDQYPPPNYPGQNPPPSG